LISLKLKESYGFDTVFITVDSIEEVFESNYKDRFDDKGEPAKVNDFEEVFSRFILDRKPANCSLQLIGTTNNLERLKQSPFSELFPPSSFFRMPMIENYQHLRTRKTSKFHHILTLPCTAVIEYPLDYVMKSDLVRILDRISSRTALGLPVKKVLTSLELARTEDSLNSEIFWDSLMDSHRSLKLPEEDVLDSLL
jgi:hypothetical protein